MANKIILKRSSVPNKAPVAGDVEYGELALNYNDGKLFYKKVDNTIESFEAGLQTINLTGAITGSGTGDITTSLSATGATAGSYTNANITVGADGRITSVANGSASGLPDQTGNSGKFLTTDGSLLSWGTIDLSNYQPVDADLTAIGGLTGTSGILTKTAANTWSLDTNTYLTTTNAASTYQPVDADLSSIAALSGTTGILKKTALNTWALDTTSYQPQDNDLTAIAGLAGTSGLLKKTAADTWTLDTSTYLTGITSGQVTTALGYTPYNSTNPNGYTTNTGTVTSIGGTGTVSGLTLTGTVTTTGNLTLGGTLAVTASNFASQTANTVLAAPDGSAGIPTFRNLSLTDLPDAWVKKSVGCATTAALTLNTAQTTIDGVTLTATTRVLVKDQATSSQNGIYTGLTTTTWVRTADADTASKIAGAFVNVDSGTVNGGKVFDNDFKATDTLGTTAMLWAQNVDTGYFTTVGNNFAKLTNPSAITFPRINADNTISTLDAATFRTAIGAGTSSTTGTVTSITAGTGLSGGTITSTGTINLANTTVTAGSYTSANITVDAQGRITSAANGTGAVIGTTTQVAYNNAGTMAGSANLTFNGTNLTCGGTITANSDETLKTNWRDLPFDYVEQLAQVKYGTYDRIDVDLTQDGISAQSLQPLLPNSVIKDVNGILSVNYGGAAMVSAVALANRVVEQDKRIAELERLIAKIIGD